jgi:catechol 2,3-dioxygenase
MELLDRAGKDLATPDFRMSPQMRLGAPTLRIKHLNETLAFYENDFGLKQKSKRYDPEDGLELVELGFPSSKEPLLILKYDANARPPAPDFAGLYHYAVLVPDRKSLASTYLGIGNSGTTFDGFADHSFSEALYLHDTEENGIEAYADRPRDTWSPFLEMMKSGNASAMYSINKPLDIGSLLRELDSGERKRASHFPQGARIGHVHLRVTNLERSVNFYNKVLGLDVVAFISEMGAAFLSVGGYHHHIGLNTWHSLDGAPHSGGQAGLEKFTMAVPMMDGLKSQFGDSVISEDENSLSLSDPDGIRIDINSL